MAPPSQGAGQWRAKSGPPLADKAELEYAVVIPTIGRASLQRGLDALDAAEGPLPTRVAVVNDRPDNPQPLPLNPPDKLRDRLAAIDGHVPLVGGAFVVVWTIVRWAATLVVASLLFSVYYYYAPNRPSPRWQWVSPGGVLFGAEINAEAEREAAVKAGEPAARRNAAQID